jgi:hypothetical protein
MELDLRNDLSAYGASHDEVLLLEKEEHSLIGYLDLLAARNPPTLAGRKPTLCPAAVIEIEGRAALYVLRVDQLAGDRPTQEAQLLDVRRAIACRGDSAPLAVIQPGQIVVFASELKTRLPTPKCLKSTDPSARWFVRDALMGLRVDVSVDLLGSVIKEKDPDQEAIHDLLFRLLTEVNTALLKTAPLRGKLDEVLSLVGRALFTRFLIDRGIINRETFPAIYKNSKPEECFADPDSAALTCRWLEDTFNGELLPLPLAKKSQFLEYFRSLATPTNKVFKILSNILYRTDEAGQLHLDWGFVDFAHVPVGLLSQVYERYAHEHFEKHAKDESVHYTPHHIANYVVSQAFEGVTTRAKDQVRVLDPAAGAGVFLVLAFRRLIAERWKATNRRPEKDEIRTILYEQIRGFDINEHALKLSALSLYLTALELDPNPFPPSALGFKKLQNLVLIPTRQRGEEFPAYPVLGSLGAAIKADHNHQYDVVLGNPPWTSWRGNGSGQINRQVEQIIRQIALERDREGQLTEVAKTYQNPDKVPDLPFVWRAMQWACDGGVIAFVLHGRLLFKRVGTGVKARDALFRALRVTGILNAAGLDANEVWPGINQPYCLLFAKNKLPSPSDVFYFTSPDREKALNSRSIIRVDYQAAQPIEWKILESKPHLLKTLFRGNALDIELIDRLQRLTEPSTDGNPPIALRLDDYWRELHLASGVGYQVARRGKETSVLLQLNGVRLTTEDTKDRVGLLIDPKKLSPFGEKELARPRDPDIYRPPLVVIDQAPGTGEEVVRGRLALDSRPIIFNESFYGYSAHGHSDGAALASYLFLLTASDLYVYYTLMTSTRFGVERRAIHGEDIKNLPVVRLENLSALQRTDSIKLAVAYARGKASALEVNRWINNVYRLEPSDHEVIRDALSVQMPFKEAREKADSVPTAEQLEAFRGRLESVLQPFFALANEKIRVEKLNVGMQSWAFFEISSRSDAKSNQRELPTAQIVSALADASGASRIIIETSLGSLLLGIVAKYRYCTPTRARLCALHVLQNHGAAFPVIA